MERKLLGDRRQPASVACEAHRIKTPNPKLQTPKKPPTPNREPSPARSGQERENMHANISGCHCSRTRCEPGTARGPVIFCILAHCWSWVLLIALSLDRLPRDG